MVKGAVDVGRVAVLVTTDCWTAAAAAAAAANWGPKTRNGIDCIIERIMLDVLVEFAVDGVGLNSLGGFASLLTGLGGVPLVVHWPEVTSDSSSSSIFILSCDWSRWPKWNELSCML